MRQRQRPRQPDADRPSRAGIDPERRPAESLLPPPERHGPAAGAARLGLRAGDLDQRPSRRQEPSPPRHPHLRRDRLGGDQFGPGRSNAANVDVEVSIEVVRDQLPLRREDDRVPVGREAAQLGRGPEPATDRAGRGERRRPVDVDVDVHRAVAIGGDERRFGFEGDGAGVVGDGGDPVGEDHRVFVDAGVGRPGAEQERRRSVLSPVDIVGGVVVGGAELRPCFEDRDRAVGGERDRPVAGEAAPGTAVGAARDQDEAAVRPALIDVERFVGVLGRDRDVGREEDGGAVGRGIGVAGDVDAVGFADPLRIGGDERERASDPLVDVVFAFVGVDQPAVGREEEVTAIGRDAVEGVAVAEMGRQGVLRPRPEHDRVGGAGDAFVDEPAGSRVTRQQRLRDRVEEDTVAVGRGAGERGERRAARVERAGRDQPRDRTRTDVVEVPGPTVDIIGGEGVGGADEYVPGVTGRALETDRRRPRAVRNRDPGTQLLPQPAVVPFVELRAARPGRQFLGEREDHARSVVGDPGAEFLRAFRGARVARPGGAGEDNRRRESQGGGERSARSHRGSGGNQVPLLEVLDQLLGRLLGGFSFGVADELGVLGRLVGV